MSFEPDMPPPRSWEVVTVWIGGFALSLALWVLAGYGLAVILGGCATGRAVVHADSSVEVCCAAIGEDAKWIYSVPTGDAGIITSAPTKLISCEGGPIIPSLGTIIADAFKALVFW